MKLLNEKSIGEIVRFVLVGLLATAIHYAIYYVLLSATGHNLAYTIGYIISFVSNFILSSLFTFKVSLSVHRLAGFAMSHLLNYLIQIVLLNVFIWMGVSASIAPLPVFVIVVPLNFLLVRYALKREQQPDDSYKFFLIVAGVAMLWLFLLEAPTLSDDMVYRFMFQADLDAACRPIQSIADLIQSQISHYQLVNGRAVVHTVAQSMIVVFPSWVCAVLNTLLFTVLVWQVVRWVGRPSQKLFVSVMVCFLLLIVVADIRSTFLWTMGTFNYLWVLVATMALLLWLRSIKEKPFSMQHLLLSPLAFLVGWSHEGLSLPLSVAFAAYMVVNRRTVFKRAVWPYLLFYMLGTLMLLLSPALWSRASEGVTVVSRLISGVTNYLFNVRIVWLLVLTLVVLWWRHRKGHDIPNSQTVKTELSRHQYIYIALVVSMGIVFLCGTNLPRVPFFADFLAMLLLLRLLADLMSATWQQRLTIGGCIVMLLFFVPIVLVRQENMEVWKSMERQMATPRQELISVPQPTTGKNLLHDYFRSHYVNPSAEFGFFNVYQAFDAQDINMRCAARLYGKERLVFLPEDVVERIKADSTAYNDYELDRHGDLFIWRMADDRPIQRLVFVLNEEDTSALWPHQRLMAYKGNTYELDDFHYETVTIDGHPYLVFTCPTSNISRRINHIEYE